MFIRKFRILGLGLTISVECRNPRIGKHGKINIILNPKPTEKEFGFMNLFIRKFEGGAKNLGMSSLRLADCSNHFPKNLPHLQRGGLVHQIFHYVNNPPN